MLRLPVRQLQLLVAAVRRGQRRRAAPVPLEITLLPHQFQPPLLLLLLLLQLLLPLLATDRLR